MKKTPSKLGKAAAKAPKASGKPMFGKGAGKMFEKMEKMEKMEKGKKC